MGLPAWLGALAGGASEIGWGAAEDMIIQMGPWNPGSDDTQARLELTRISYALIPDGEEVLYGIVPCHGHGDLTLLNGGPEDVSVEVHLSYAGEPVLVELIPGEPWTIEAFTPADPVDEFAMIIMNVSMTGADAEITVEETYPFDLVFTHDPADNFQVTLRRQAEGAVRDGLSFLVEGQSSDPSASLYMSVRPVSSDVTAVPEFDPGVATGTVLKLRPAFPNPFGAKTRVHFDLHKESRVDLAIYDVRGRLVRRFAAATLLPGRHHVTWGGRDNNGQRAADGVYFLAVSVDGQLVGRTKLTLIK
jgi:hypothetical protein